MPAGWLLLPNVLPGRVAADEVCSKIIFDLGWS